MKNLKKILIVIAVLALLVASFATVIVADEDQSKGSVAEIEKWVTTIESEIAKPSTDARRNPVGKVTSAYEYVRNTALDWDGVIGTPEYDAAIAKLEVLCVQVASELSTKAKTADDLAAAYTFIVSCAPAETTAGYADVVAAITAKNEVYTEESYSLISMPVYDAENIDHAKLYSDIFRVKSADGKITDGTNAQIRNLYKLIKACPWVSEEKATKYSMAAYDLTTLMLDEYEYFLQNKTDSSDDYFKTVNDIRSIEAFVVATDISKAAGYSATMDRLNAGLAIAEAAIEAKRKSLDELAPFEEYDYGVFLQKNWDGSKTPEEYSELTTSEKQKYDEENSHFPYPNASGGHKTEKVFESLYGRENNGYLKFMYGVGNNIHHYTYFDLAKAKGKEDDGLVFEWDMRVNEKADTSIVMQGVDTINKEAGLSVFQTLFVTLRGDENFVKLRNLGDNKYSIQQVPTEDRSFAEKAMVLDVWTHFIMTYNPETRMGALYVNYEKVFDIYHFGYAKVNANYRFGPNSTSGWEGWDFDNFDMYYGTAFRIKDKFSSMSEDEKFEYFVNYAFDGMGHPEEYLSRDNAYKKAELLVGKYGDTHPGVIKFRSIDYKTDIKDPAMKQNLGILTEKITKLENDFAVTTENITVITDTIKDINAFVSKNASLIDKADTSEGGYQDMMAVMYNIEANVKKLEILKKFVDAVIRFERATTLSARTRYANLAAEFYAEAEYELEENRIFVANDPVVVDFEKGFNGQKVEGGKDDDKYLKPTDKDGKPTPGYIAEDDPRYVQIFEYYDTFAKLLAEREKLENSKNIINAMNTISKMDGYEATDAFFAANYDELKPYTTLIRSYISNGSYDTEYPGIDEAIASFFEMDPYFFERLQLEHIDAIEKMLAKYDKVSTLVEKVAVVNSVKAYFEENDTALNNTTINKATRTRVEDEREALEKLMAQNDVYAIELEGYEESYLDVLTQQTEYFINIINHMNSVITFAEIKDLFEEASVYYYGINLNVEGALEAAEKYAEYRAYIDAVNTSNEAFAMYMKDLAFIVNDEDIVGVEKRDEMFKVLKNINVYIDFVDATNKNIAKQLETYYAALEAYENNITAIENAVYEGVQFTNAIRTIKLPATVLSVIGKLINN